MKNFSPKLLTTLALTIALPIATQTANASSSFSAEVTLSVTLDGLSNLSSGTDFSGLSYDFTPFSGDYNEIVSSGDAIVTDQYNTSGLLPLSLAGTFTESFSVSGNVNNGDASGYFESFSDLSFFNHSTTDSYQLDLTFAYTLSASVSGEFADADASIMYFDENGLTSVVETDAAAFASVFGSQQDNVSDSLSISLILAPGDYETLYADAFINGSIAASSPAPVPVPAAFWFFASALFPLARARKMNKS